MSDIPGSVKVEKSAPRILVAEDEALIRLDLVEMLTEAGYTVVAQATNGLEAIALAREFKPDLAILDVKMPELDGISAAQEIIEIAPVLMLTAFSQRELVERARDAGVMAYVVKPFGISDLIPAIEIAMSRHLQMRALKSEVSDLYERLETRKIIDKAKGILMAAMALSEPEAFSWIQRAAMDRRLTMKEVALAITDPSKAEQLEF
ncbi:MAG: response regulator [Actinomycetota bacterium]|jgi:two-component system, response regulator PdtaR|tara:strand:- start:25115 stop:25732 length:618 start_codon:yes stop_codon:yes gene_type:complete